jgi:hypothetical protein
MAKGAVLQSPGALRRDNGDICVGWRDSAGQEYFIGETIVEGPLQLYPMWEKTLYAISLDPEGGTWREDDSSAMRVIEATYGQSVYLPEISKTGETLEGWKDSMGKPFIPGETLVYGNMTSTPVFRRVVEIKLDVVNGSWGDGAHRLRVFENVLSGSKLDIPAYSPPAGHYLEHWYSRVDESAVWDFDDIIHGNIDLIAKWSPIPEGGHRVTLKLNGGVWVHKGIGADLVIPVEEGGQIAFPQPRREGYTLTGWQTEDGQLWDDKKPVTEDTTLTTVWQGLVQVSFEPMGADPIPPIYTEANQPYGKHVPGGELPHPIRPGYTFKGWHSAAVGGREITPETLAIEGSAHTLFARWAVRQVIVQYNWMDQERQGATNHTIRNAAAEFGTRFGSLIQQTPVHTDQTLNFQGWYTETLGGVLVESGDLIATSTTVYARWAEGEHNITFEVSGERYHQMTRDSGELLQKPDDPERHGYLFEGWYTSGRKWNFDSDPVSSDIVLAARFVSERPPPGRLGVISAARVELPVSDRFPETNNSVSWEKFIPMLNAKVIDEDGRDLTGQAVFTSAGYVNIDFKKRGEYNIGFAATADGKTAVETVVVAVVDRTPPVIHIQNRNIQVTAGQRPSLGLLLARAGVVVHDNYDTSAELRPSFQDIAYGDINWKEAGEHVLVLNASDSSGNQAVAQRVIVTVGESDVVVTLSVVNNNGESFTATGADGKALGSYHMARSGVWVYSPIEDSKTPNAALPFTGDAARMPVILTTALLSLAALFFRLKGYKKEI